MPDLSINVGTEHSTLDHSSVSINPNHEDEQLRARVKELEQFVFGDQRLGISGIRQQLQGQRFWTLFNVILTIALFIGLLVVYLSLRLP